MPCYCCTLEQFQRTSWSSESNNGESKNSFKEISNPSQIFLIVAIVVLLFLPLTMLLSVDCVIPQMMLKRLIVIPRELHRSIILSFTAFPTLLLSIRIQYWIIVDKVNSNEL